MDPMGKGGACLVLNGGSFLPLELVMLCQTIPSIFCHFEDILGKEIHGESWRILMIHTGLLISNYTTGYQIVYPHFDIQLRTQLSQLLDIKMATACRLWSF